ncbi:type I restriction enzyme, S subunit [Phyllobacterium sp. CL33Tsu]|uniref:restriction endonuclease subunit S n=1 Tax=Phyllobacterium sp. CL33Tsu TaxID=1798191 RepID=UPI0008F44842|nr:restriction endonuclease subunit S [Phyllobacterium sp. CL33Tsu]SFI64638.1 type I restriction enzyme, S subunit [Phyllobacterium sp. CL33Tsu]
MKQLVELGNVADVNWGDTSTTKGAYVDEGFKAYSATGPDGFLPYADHNREAVVLSAIGARCGKTWFASGKWSCIKNTIRFWSTTPHVDNKYLYWVTNKEDFFPKRGAAQPFITIGDARKALIPLPPLNEQKRIAAILDKADQLRQKRRQAIALLDNITQSIFLEMFGDPVSNPKGWDQATLGEVTEFMSGGTPSKSSPSFWVGNTPWVSPKDMKTVVIRDSIDHISENAVEHSAAKLAPENAVLIVVRGMILAHSVPIGILARQAAFNQDIKALLFHDVINPLFGLWNLVVQVPAILKEVSTAAHGTKRLEMVTLSRLPVLCPPIALQKQFADQCANVDQSLKAQTKAAFVANLLFHSLQEAAFSGKGIMQ